MSKIASGLRPHLYELTPADCRRLSANDDGSIIASGPWIKGPCELPHRVVLRTQESGGYVIHVQVLSESPKPYYYNGHYFPDAIWFAGAWERFEERCRHYLHIQNDPEESET